jgi:3-hydroxymyristoyl/3-hydroxydecanoyl-(acyl carrier protein) dehydratase
VTEITPAPPPAFRDLPHRVPFVLVDRVIDVGDGRARFVKAVTRNDALLGGWPVLPPSLLMEALAQAAGMLVASTVGRSDLLLLVAADGVGFGAPVRCGERLMLEVVLERARPPFYVVAGRALVGGDVRAEGRLTMARSPDVRRAGATPATTD